MSFGGEITEEDAERAAEMALQCHEKFMRPMVEWIAAQTGEDKAWLGAFILAQGVGVTLGLMLYEADESDVIRYQARLTDQLIAALERVHAQKAEIMAAREVQHEGRGSVTSPRSGD